MEPALPSEETARRIAERHSRKSVHSVTRFPAGLCHHVYEVTWSDGSQVVVRIARPGNEAMLRGAVYWHDRLRPIGIPLATILEADLGASEFAFAFLVLERLDGTDLGEAYPSLSNESKRTLGARVAALQQIVAGLPAGRGYGDAFDNEAPGLAPDWGVVVARQIEVCRARVGGRSLLSARDVTVLERSVSEMQPLLARVRPTAFLDDITTKNVIITANGRLSGIVDVDTLCFGDPLFTLGLTRAACVQLGYDREYTDAWQQQLGLDDEGRARLDFYARLFAAVLLSEHGQQFNRDARVRFEPDAIRRLRDLLR